MNFECNCRCGQSFQTGDAYRKTDRVMAVRIFGNKDGYPAVWLDLQDVERLIRELEVYRDKLAGHETKD